MGNADGVLCRNPAHPVGAVLIAVALGVAAEAHEAGLIGVGQLPGPAALEPLIGDLHLPAIADQLVKNAEFVADAVAGGWDFQRGQRLQEAGRQSPQASVAQARLLFDIEDLVDVVDAETAQGFCRFLLDAQHQQVVAQLGPDQKFSGEVGHHPSRGGTERLNASQVSGHQPVAHRVAEGHVEVVAAGRGGELAERVKKVFGHAVEHVFRGQATAIWVGVAARGGQTQVAGLEVAHLSDSPAWAAAGSGFHRQLVTSSASMPCSWAWARLAKIASFMRSLTWAAREPRPATRSITSITKLKRSI